MFPNSGKIVLLLIVTCVWPNLGVISASTKTTKRPFTVVDDIQLAVFGGTSGSDDPLVFSPDRAYFVVETERGRLDLNRPEGSLRFYRCKDVAYFLKAPNPHQTPSPLWVVNRSTDREGRIIKKWRWLPDSSGVAFLERLPNAPNSYQLVLADVRKRTFERLTPATQAVDEFDIRDREHYVYTAAEIVSLEKVSKQHVVPSTIGTGHSLSELLLPNDARTIEYYSHRTYYLWARLGQRRFAVKDKAMPLTPLRGLALSPDGYSVVLVLPVAEVPHSWETLYPPPFSSDPYRIHAGQRSAHQYVLLNLQTLSMQSLTDAPVSNDAGWWLFSNPSWSRDGQAVLLPGTFLESKENSPSKPCVAVITFHPDTRTCVQMLKDPSDTAVPDKLHSIKAAQFVDGSKRQVRITFHGQPDYYATSTIEYQLTLEGTWQSAEGLDGFIAERNDHRFEVEIEAGLNEPPRVIATDGQTSRTIWDPNPQLTHIELNPATVYTWNDAEGRNWKGGLFKPHGYREGQRYPLIIQTHGFSESRFIPSGVFPTAFAARALAAAGIAVLQVPESAFCPLVTFNEGSCVVSGYEAAVKQLVAEGLVDPEQIGIIGFSRTCFYVMETVTKSELHVKAASITDGFVEGYFQYLLDIGANEANAMIGAPPFGDGLSLWQKRSPEFNLDKVNAALLVVAAGPNGTLQMWEPYAGLRSLRKPVDLIVLNTDEHVLTNPAVRMASQGGTVDWFRFWLQGYESPDTGKVEQYARWRELRKLQRQPEHR
jgi:dipeptidyl aminopeptidase/acylaminoacyl peptidase